MVLRLLAIGSPSRAQTVIAVKPALPGAGKMLPIEREQPTVAWIEEPSFEPGRNPMAELDRLGSCHFNDAAPKPRTSLYQGQQTGVGIVHNKEARGRHRPARGNLR
jgi:hypothetical protein